ncbi:hypothetical protein PHLGIDRAFT_100657 [Phlebiopsis gigantea 11061_1 CR5-6]|uniref:UV-endonuclease UvdE n=1 Tax=Phlebiopsis gigantea (strain 11061_1 CR5-6) TaxID=745531 RepID=A0A0C3PTH0_PHLG1|nr:hypothetical protein PHLGIDRAFT_100657 [Phlebiopsis gigantea 11061_1 CR5-6]
MAKRKRVGVNDLSAAVEDDGAAEATEELVAPRRKSSRKKTATQGWDPYASANASSPLTSPSPSPSPAKTKSPRKGRRKTRDPVVYDIPPITDFKTTAFKGRLGYACLNTILRVADPPVFCSRTCRIATLKEKGLQYAKDLGIQNTRDLKKMVEWNEENGIKFMRISSEMFPFASHKEWGYKLEYAKEALKEAGDTAKRLGHRLTTHPGQFTQLASPKENVVEASIRELDYHCQMMRYMGLGKDSVIILHMGGVYGDKTTTIARFKTNYTTLLTEEMKARLVLENDEICYSPDDLLPVCEELDIPIVLDYHHNYINPSSLPLSELIPRINKTWEKKGIRVKQHLSEPRPETKKVSVMELRAHADRCTSLPDEVVFMGMDGAEGGGDLMIEAKDKEQAVFQLYRIYSLQPVKHENLRPEKAAAPQERAAKGGDEQEDGEAASPKRQRGRKAAASQDNDDASPPDFPQNDAQKSPRKQGKKVAEVKVGASSPKRRKTKANSSKAADIDSLMNQEDAPVPVDGAPLPVVEAEEHPEAVKAATEGAGGCGVKGGKKSPRKARKATS